MTDRRFFNWQATGGADDVRRVIGGVAVRRCAKAAVVGISICPLG